MNIFDELKDNFIGLFDSGFGGLSVLNYCLDLMPNENYVFYADSTNCPYGKRTRDNLVEIGKNIINKFNNFNPKSLIIACGTMSTSNPEELRRPFPNLNIIGTYPDFEQVLKPNMVIENHSLSYSLNDGLKINRNRIKILILATTATCKSPYLKDKVNAYKNLLDIYVEPADMIVKAVENDEIDSFYLRNYLTKLLDPYYDVNYVVLGCTHFPFAKDVIANIINDKAILTSGCEVAANKCYHYLENQNSLATKQVNEKYKIIIVDANLDDKRKNTFFRLLNADKNKYDIIYEKDISI